MFAGGVCCDAAEPQRKNQQPAPGDPQPPTAVDLQVGRGRDKATPDKRHTLLSATSVFLGPHSQRQHRGPQPRPELLVTTMLRSHRSTMDLIHISI